MRNIDDQLNAMLNDGTYDTQKKYTDNLSGIDSLKLSWSYTLCERVRACQK